VASKRKWSLQRIVAKSGEFNFKVHHNHVEPDSTPMITRTRQEIVMSETRVTGCFRHGDIFQIRPIYPDAPILEWPIGHHPFLLEYRYNIPEVSETNCNPDLPEPGLSALLDDECSSKVKKWILLVISMFSISRVFQYGRHPNRERWFVELPWNTKDFKVSSAPLWGYAGYHYQGAVARIVDDFSHPDNVSIRLVDTHHYYRAHTL
jgi:hypothetical protein